MSRFSLLSHERLSECDSKLRALFSRVVYGFDCSVLTGHRPEAQQTIAYLTLKSTKKWPDSKHNKMPSQAVDVGPYPINWEDIKRHYMFGGYVLGVAYEMGIEIRWGGDWDMDTDVHDQKLFDLVHFELTGG